MLSEINISSNSHQFVHLKVINDFPSLFADFSGVSEHLRRREGNCIHTYNEREYFTSNFIKISLACHHRRREG